MFSGFFNSSLLHFFTSSLLHFFTSSLLHFFTSLFSFFYFLLALLLVYRNIDFCVFLFAQFLREKYFMGNLFHVYGLLTM
jgi:hypothetical protein